MERLTAPTIGPPLARQRAAVLAILLALALVAWLAVFAQSDDGDMVDMGMGMGMEGPDLTMGSASLFFSMWVAMMVAMMFPAAAPMILLYARTQRGWRHVSTALFTGSYIAIWIAFGAIAFAIAAGTEQLVEHSEWVADNWGRVGGGLIVLAGIYQLSPLKDFCLTRCRTPMSFLMHSWRDGRRGALMMGLHHGLFCFGCCWLLFLALVPIGVMNVAAMLLVAAVVFAEKALPWGRGVARLAALGLVAYGAVVIFRPEALPTVA